MTSKSSTRASRDRKDFKKAITGRRLGRPRSAAKTARRNRLVTLVTDSEFDMLKTVADAKGRSISALVHQIVSQFLGRRK